MHFSQDFKKKGGGQFPEKSNVLKNLNQEHPFFLLGPIL